MPERPDGRRAGSLLLLLAAAAAVAHRLFLAAATDFPINDGGLFYAFVNATAASFPALPTTVAFNGLVIPFAYPPLSFWFGALLTRLGADPLAVVHLLPIAMNAVYVLLFALVLRKSGRSPLFAALALLFFCTVLRSFEWLVMGGGLSRGAGSLFLMLTLLAVRVPMPGRREPLAYWRWVAAGAAVAGAILSHLEWGIDAAACVVLARAISSRSFANFVASTTTAGATALLLILPWLAFVYQAHGLAPLFAAGGTSPWGIVSFKGHLLWLGSSSLANPLVPLGLVLLLLRRDFFWPLFLLICIALTPRHAPTPAVLALAVFAATGAVWLFEQAAVWVRPRWIGAAVTTLLILLLASLQLNRRFLADGPALHPLSPAVRHAMRWVAERHPGDSFLVLTSAPWWYDRSAEWFPVLARARSVNTLQGREWLPDKAYARWYARDIALKTSGNCAALLNRMRAYEPPHYYWVEWRRGCFLPADFAPVFRNAEVTIFERRTEAD